MSFRPKRCILRLNVFLLAVAIQAITIPPDRARAADWQNFESFRSFLYADKQKLNSTFHFVPLSPQDPLDRMASDILQKVDQVTGESDRLSWVAECGAFANPLTGIALDKEQLAKFEHDLGPKNFRIVLMLVIAHEQGHMRQFRKYGEKVFLEPQHTRELELQADILSGSASGIILAQEVRQELLQGERVQPGERIRDLATGNLFFKLGQMVGHPAWADATKHPRPDQRAIGVIAGQDGGVQWIMVQQYLELRRTGPVEAADKLLADIEEHDKRWPNMPHFDKATLTMEGAMAWSQRIAKRMLEPDYVYSDGVKEYRERNGVKE